MKKLIRYILPVLMFALPVTAMAQDTSGEVIRRMSGAIKALGDYTVTFKLTAEGNTMVGEYTVSRDRFSLNVADMEVYSDGRTRYEINHSEDEILIDALDPSSREVFSNPTRAFDFTDDAFTHSYRGVTTIAGKEYHIVNLVPKDKDSSVRNVEITIDKATSLPHSISYAADGLTGYVIVEVVKIGKAGTVPDSLFKPDMALYRGYEVIDFR